MNADTFAKLLSARIGKIRRTLLEKSGEYSADDNILHNFYTAAMVNDTTMAKALWGMATKHLISIMDMIQGRQAVNSLMIDEKIGDMINYLILLEAVFTEHMNIQELD